MPLDPFFQKGMLDYCLGGATAPSSPAGRWLEFATQSPTSQSAFPAPVNSRRTVSFAAANSPQGSKTNLNAITATATAICTIVGWNIWDSSQGGTRLAYGTFSSSIGCASADLPAIAAGGLKVVLS